MPKAARNENIASSIQETKGTYCTVILIAQCVS